MGRLRNAELYEAQLKIKHEKRILELPVQEEISINELFLLYEKHIKKYLRPRTLERDKGSLRFWRRFFSNKSIAYNTEIRTTTWSEFRDWRKKRLTCRNKYPSNRTINLDLQTINKCFKWAIEQNIVTSNPFAKAKQYKEKKPGLPRYLTTEEIKEVEKLAVKISPFFLPCFSALVRTGMRSGELCSLEINNIDFDRKQIILDPEQTKAATMRRIPFKDNVAEILQHKVEQAKKDGRQFLFETTKKARQTTGNLNHRFRTILRILEKEGKIENGKEIHIHSLRRTYISHLIMAGVEPIRVMAIVGHKDWSTVRRYLVLSPDYVGEAQQLPY